MLGGLLGGNRVFRQNLKFWCLFMGESLEKCQFVCGRQHFCMSVQRGVSSWAEIKLKTLKLKTGNNNIMIS